MVSTNVPAMSDAELTEAIPWVAAKVPAALFRFTPPEGAARVEVVAFARPDANEGRSR